MTYSDAVLSAGPSVYWKFDESSGLPPDSSGNGRNGGTTGSPPVRYDSLIPSDQSGWCAHFDGTNSMDIYVPDATWQDPAELSIEVWFNLTSAGIIVIRSNGGSNDSYQVIATAGGNLTVRGGQTFTGISAPFGTLNHLVFTTSTTTGAEKVYLNGQVVASGTSGASRVRAGGQSLILGRDLNYQRPLNGDIDEFALYNKILSPTQVTEHYDLGMTVVDTDPPYAFAIVTSETDEDGYGIAPATIGLGVIDDNPKTSQYSLDGGPLTAFNYGDSFVITTPGEHSVRLLATDQAGNVSDNVTTITVSGTVPDVTDVRVTVFANNTKPVAWLVTANNRAHPNAAYTFQYKLTGANIQGTPSWTTFDFAGQGPCSLYSPPGDYNVQGRAIDGNGNTFDSAIASLTLTEFAQDTTPPLTSVEITSDMDDDGNYPSPITMVLHASDDSGPEYLTAYYVLDGAPEISYTDGQTLSIGAYGQHTLLTRALDGYNHLSDYVTTNFNVVEPVLLPPSEGDGDESVTGHDLPAPGLGDIWGDALNKAIRSMHLGPGTHDQMPNPASTVRRAIFVCTTHDKVHINTGTTWADYFTLPSV